MSRARQCQLVADEQDDRLTLLAQSLRPKARHWWGRRWITPLSNPDAWIRTTRTEDPETSGSGRNGALCYICDYLIASWASGWHLPKRARVLIDLHRTEHLTGILAAPVDTRGGER